MSTIGLWPGGLPVSGVAKARGVFLPPRLTQQCDLILIVIAPNSLGAQWEDMFHGLIPPANGREDAGATRLSPESPVQATVQSEFLHNTGA